MLTDCLEFLAKFWWKANERRRVWILLGLLVSLSLFVGFSYCKNEAAHTEIRAEIQDMKSVKDEMLLDIAKKVCPEKYADKE